MASIDTTIRRATQSDALALADLGASTFTESFGHLYPAQDLEAFLAATHSLENWRSILKDSRRDALLAECANGTGVGFVLTGPCKLPVKDLEPAAGEIQQLYVAAEFQNHRLGARLMEAGSTS